MRHELTERTSRSARKGYDAKARHGLTAGLEPLDPGPELDLPRPDAAVLLEKMKVRAGNGVWIEHGVGCFRRLFPTGVPDRAINHHVGHVNALRGKLSGDTLRQSAQGELRPSRDTGGPIFTGAHSLP